MARKQPEQRSVAAVASLPTPCSLNALEQWLQTVQAQRPGWDLTAQVGVSASTVTCT